MARIALVILSAIALAACHTSPPRVGNGGWREVESVPDTSIHVRQPGGEVQIGEYKAGNTYFIRYFRPLGSARVPLYPGSVHHDTQERPAWINYIYRMPDDKRFTDLYRWYADWFAFKAPETK